MLCSSPPPQPPARRPTAYSAHLQHGLRLIKQLPGLPAHRLVVEDLGVASVGVAPPQLPHLHPAPRGGQAGEQARRVARGWRAPRLALREAPLPGLSCRGGQQGGHPDLEERNENGRKESVSAPHLEERVPVDVRQQLFNRHVQVRLRAQLPGPYRRILRRAPVHLRAAAGRAGGGRRA